MGKRKKLTIKEGIKNPRKFLREKAKQERLAKEVSAIADSFTPSEKDAQSFVLIGRDGKRLPPNSRKKAAIFYVNKNLKAKLLTKDATEKAASFAFDKTKKKNALAKIYTETHTLESLEIRPRGKYEKSKRGIDWMRAAGLIQRKLEKFANEHRSGKFFVDVAFSVKRDDGGIRTYKVTVPLFSAKKGKNELKKFVQGKIYAHIADKMGDYGIVSWGSNFRVSRLLDNVGNERTEWTRAFNGAVFPWDGADSDIVSFQSFSVSAKKVVRKGKLK